MTVEERVERIDLVRATRRAIKEQIRAEIVAAITEEREACAQIVEHNRFIEPGEVADLIRARSDEKPP